MKTKLAALTLSLVFVLGISGCYTEFATTGGNYGGYGSSYNSGSSADTSQYGYSPTYYDSTGALAINPNYLSDQYGYGTYGMGGYGIGTPWPYYGYPGWSYSMFVPSAAWWSMEPWYFGFGMGLGFGGPYSYAGLAGWGNWPSYYYSYLGVGYPYNSFYNVYNPYSPYSPYYPWYVQGSVGQPARLRNNDGIRTSRTYGDVPTTPSVNGGASAGYTNGGSTSGSQNVSGGTRLRTPTAGTENSVRSSGESQTVNNRQRVRERMPRYSPASQQNPNATSGNSQPRTRGREQAPSYTPPAQQNPSSGSNSQPKSSPPPRVRERTPRSTPPPQRNSAPQQQPQPRVRERAPSYNPPPQQNQAPAYNPPPQYNPPPSNPAPQAPPPRIRHRSMSYSGTPVQAQPVREIRVMRQRANYVSQLREARAYQTPHFRESAPSYNYHQVSAPRMSAMRSYAPSAPSRGAASGGGGRVRH